VLRALSLCTCCRQYPGTATDGTSLLIPSVVSAFPRRAAGSACASSFSRLIQRSLALRPAHSRCHQNLWPAIRRLQPFRYLHDCSGCFRLEHFAGWGFHPLEKRRLCTAHAQSGRIFRFSSWPSLFPFEQFFTRIMLRVKLFSKTILNACFIGLAEQTSSVPATFPVVNHFAACTRSLVSN